VWDLTKITALKNLSVPRDWSPFGRLDFWYYTVEPTGAAFLLIVFSENGASTGPDYYWLPLKVDWSGWKRFELPYRAFRPNREPLGWDRVSGLALYSSGYRDCVEVPGTKLTLDDMRLVAPNAEAGCVLGDFEFDTPAWQGLTRDTETKHGGEGSGKWADLQTTKLVRCTSVPHDWTGWDNLELWVHSATANQQQVKVLLYSDDPGTEKTDCYGFLLRVDWQGWKFLTVRKEQFSPNHSLVGWRKIDCLTIGADGWGLKALPDTCLWLDEVRLVRKSPEHPANEGRPAATAGRTTGDRSRKLVAGERK